MIVDDVFDITGKGLVLLGQVLNEKIEVGQKVIIDPEFLPEFESEITGIETFRKNLKVAYQNDNVGIVLKGVKKKGLKRKWKFIVYRTERAN